MVGARTASLYIRPSYFVSCKQQALSLSDASAADSRQSCSTDCSLFIDRAKYEAAKRAAAEEAAQRAADEQERARHARAAEERRKRRIAVATWPFRMVGAFLGWYAKAPWQTQVFLAFVALVILAPVYAKSLAERRAAQRRWRPGSAAAPARRNGAALSLRPRDRWRWID